MKIREKDENGELGDYKKIDPNSKTKDEIIADLQAENTDLRQQLAQFNNDFVAFTDFYFVKNPTQA